jgi:nucleoside 2-deoxyribosyltransferase
MNRPKIYFACSVRGGRENLQSCKEIVEHAKKKADILSEIFIDTDFEEASKPNSDWRKHCMNWINEADAIIAELTTPSLGVGYEIATAEQLGKPVLGLFSPGQRKLSATIDASPKSRVVYYSNPREIFTTLDEFINQLQ